MKIFFYSIVLLSTLLQSCKIYRQDILFQLDDEFTEEDLSTAVSITYHNYTIQPGDRLNLQVFTNEGERIIDPNFELMKDLNVGNNINRIDPEYLVQENGIVKIPLLDRVKVQGLTLIEAEQKLQVEYNEFYKGSYVILTYLNKRVTVLGANGGMMIPLENQNTTLLEVLALYGGLQFGSKAQNIKVIRGDLQDPSVYMVNLNTISSMKKSITDVQPGDIIYVEPWRRPLKESIRDASPILSLASSILALTIIIQNASQ